jgi:hypothetical protein
MAITTAQKLKIKEGTKILLLNAPKGIEKMISPLPKGAGFITESRLHDYIILFVQDKKELEKYFLSTVKLLNTGAFLWIGYPKGTSGIQTDLTRDKGWEILEKVDMTWASLVSLDDTWSLFCLKNIPAKKEASKASNDYHNHIAEWIDTTNKTIKIPDDLNKAMVKGGVKKFFDTLNFSNRKEYVIWIVSAKQEPTRKDRILKAIDKLKNGLKNPTMK